MLAHAARLAGERGRRQEQRVEVVRTADGRHLVAHHRGVVVHDLHGRRDVRIPVPRVFAAPLGARRSARGDDCERARDRKGRGSGQQLASAQGSFRHA